MPADRYRSLTRLPGGRPGFLFFLALLQFGIVFAAALVLDGGGESRPVPSPPPQGQRVTAVGDSILLSAAEPLAALLPNLEMDAVVGRQVPEAIDALEAIADRGELGDVVLVHIGNNGEFSSAQFDEFMAIAGDRQVLFVNTKEPRPWEEENNRVIAEGVARYPNAILVDWHTASIYRPELFWDDELHLRPAGTEVYARLIASYLTASYLAQ